MRLSINEGEIVIRFRNVAEKMQWVNTLSRHKEEALKLPPPITAQTNKRLSLNEEALRMDQSLKRDLEQAKTFRESMPRLVDKQDDLSVDAFKLQVVMVEHLDHLKKEARNAQNEHILALACKIEEIALKMKQKFTETLTELHAIKSSGSPPIGSQPEVPRRASFHVESCSLQAVEPQPAD